MIARPCAGEVGDDAVDLGLGLDVDALGRLVQDQEARVGREPLRQHDLLLVAAGQRLDRLAIAAKAQPQPLEMAPDQAQLAPGPDQPGGRRLADHRQRGVGQDARSPSPGSGRSGPRRHRPRRPPWRRRARRRRPRGRRAGRCRRSARSTPNRTRAISVRPLPTRPAKPRTSPARTREGDLGEGAGARQAAHLEHRPARRRRRAPGTCRRAPGRPSG